VAKKSFLSFLYPRTVYQPKKYFNGNSLEFGHIKEAIQSILARHRSGCFSPMLELTYFLPYYGQSRKIFH